MDSSAGVGARIGVGFGSISLITGPMFAGKTTELMRRLRRFEIAGKTVKIIKHAKDTRYGADGKVVTHDTVVCSALVASSLGDEKVMEEMRDAHVIGIDEGQFFEDLSVICCYWADKGKNVIVAALDTNFMRLPFPYAETFAPDFISKLTAVCARCNSEATFTRRTSDDTDEVVVGGAETYEAVCRACYNVLKQPPVVEGS